MYIVYCEITFKPETTEEQASLISDTFTDQLKYGYFDEGFLFESNGNLNYTISGETDYTISLDNAVKALDEHTDSLKNFSLIYTDPYEEAFNKYELTNGTIRHFTGSIVYQMDALPDPAVQTRQAQIPAC